MDPFLILMVLSLAAGVLVLARAVRRRHDRSSRATWGAVSLGYALTGLGLSALTLVPVVFFVYVLLPVVVYPIGLSVFRWRERADAAARRDLLLGQGVSPADAREATQVKPLGFVPILALYVCFAYLWVGVVLLCAWLVDEGIVGSPTFRIPSSDPVTPSLDVPWWFVGVAGLCAMGGVHAFVNMWRRQS